MTTSGGGTDGRGVAGDDVAGDDVRDAGAVARGSGDAAPSSGSRPATVRTLPGVPGLGGLYVRAVTPRPGRLLARLPGIGVDAPDAAGAVSLPDVTYRVADVVADPEHLLAYQRLLGEPADDRLPAGFVHVLAFPVAMALMVRPDFPLPVAGMVHLANHVTVLRPVTVDEELEVHAWAENLRPHRRGTQVDLVTEVSARYGEGDATALVWRGVSTYLAKTPTPSDLSGRRDGVRAPRPDSSGNPSDVSDAQRRLDQPASDNPGSPLELSDAYGPPGRQASDSGHAALSGHAGNGGHGEDSAGGGDGRTGWARFPTGQWALDAGTGRRYAAVSGDRNPIHLSGLTAKAFGFPRAIAHGMYTASRALAEVGAARGDAYEWTVEFAKPVLLPGRVAVAIAPDNTAAAAHEATTGARAFRYVGWDARSGKEHFTGSVVPLPG